MSSSSILIALVLVATVPLVTLVHELGHGWAAMALTTGPVGVDVGSQRGATTVSAGRLTVSVSFTGLGGICRFDASRLSRRRAVAVVLAGPAANVVLAAVLTFAALAVSGVGHWLLLDLAAISALQFLGNLIPGHALGGLNHGRANDGLRAWSLVRRRPIPPPKPRASARRSGRLEPVPAPQLVGLFAGAVLGVLAATHSLPADQVMALGAAMFLVGVQDRMAWSVRPAIAAGKITTTAGAAGVSAASRPPAASLPLKTCPSCGERILATAKVCFCYQTFE